MAEWFKAAVLKTAGRKPRGFESYSLRQPLQKLQLASHPIQPTKLSTEMASNANASSDRPDFPEGLDGRSYIKEMERRDAREAEGARLEIVCSD